GGVSMAHLYSTREFASNPSPARLAAVQKSGRPSGRGVERNRNDRDTPGRLRRDVPAERVQVEACALQVATEAHATAVYHVDDGGDHLLVRPGVPRNRTHEIEQRDAACHRHTLRR